jgi:hypothetical protein
MTEGSPDDEGAGRTIEETILGVSLSGSCGRGVNAGEELPTELDWRPTGRPLEFDDGAGRSSLGSGETGAGDGR